jgi:predicted RND superfamily exporter protein
VITARKGNLKDVEFLKGLDALVTEVLDYREPQTGEKIVTHALSLLDVVKETRRAFKGGDRAAYALPTSQQEANDFLFAFENQSPSELSKLTTIDWSKTHVTFRVRWREATAYGPLIEHIKKSAQTHLGDRVDIAGTGPVYVVTRLVKVMLDDLAKSFGTAFLLVSIFMVFMLRDLKLGLVAMMPNLFPILLVMGFMGLSAMPLDLNTLLIASIALGIAVDDTVHFLHHFQASFVATKDCELGIQAAKRHAGRAMLTTSLVLTVGFIILCLASNDALIRFGLLTALTIVSALFTDLIVLPAFLRWLYPRRTSTDFATHQSDLSQSH